MQVCADDDEGRRFEGKAVSQTALIVIRERGRRVGRDRSRARVMNQSARGHRNGVESSNEKGGEKSGDTVGPSEGREGEEWVSKFVGACEDREG